MTYSFTFLTALGRWQRGWRRDPVLRRSIGIDLIRAAAGLPIEVRSHDGSAVYRKRNIYRRDDQRELAPLFLTGELDEGGPTSWSTDLQFAEAFGPIFDTESENSVAGAIFKHIPTDGEVVLNIPRLWQDSHFEQAVESYRNDGGLEAEALFHFRGEREQFEIILTTPLRSREIYKLGRSTTVEGIYATAGATLDVEKDAIDALMNKAGIDPTASRYLSPERTAAVVERTIDSQKLRWEKWMADRSPSRPLRRKARLVDAIELGKENACDNAIFLGWRRLRGRGGMMEGRWSDGTVAYHGSFGHIWIY